MWIIYTLTLGDNKFKWEVISTHRRDSELTLQSLSEQFTHRCSCGRWRSLSENRHRFQSAAPHAKPSDCKRRDASSRVAALWSWLSISSTRCNWLLWITGSSPTRGQFQMTQTCVGCAPSTLPLPDLDLTSIVAFCYKIKLSKDDHQTITIQKCKRSEIWSRDCPLMISSPSYEKRAISRQLTSNRGFPLKKGCRHSATRLLPPLGGAFRP